MKALESVEASKSPPRDDAAALAALAARFAAVRALTGALCAPLATEDYVVQSMPDASPTRWHLAHTTWFFETFVLEPFAPGYAPFDPAYRFLFNSYYEAVGPRHPRAARGLITRPTVAEIYRYRAAVDEAVAALLAAARSEDRAPLAARVELGLHHEQQHQELILTDIQHALSLNPIAPAYRPGDRPPPSAKRPLEFRAHAGGVLSFGHRGEGFAFDNELPVHRVLLEPFALATRAVTCGEFLEFIRDGGYERPEFWLSDGWATARAEQWHAPLYWSHDDDRARYTRFSLYGQVELEPDAPVCHVSFYEADAYARWAKCRLPTEFEWEAVVAERPRDGQFVEDGALTPVARADDALVGGQWVWTASPYVAYPGFAPAAGALGEYNGKFMCNQLVLRGGSCFTPRSHVRPTYRNFFPPAARWQVSGIRLCRAP